MKKKDNRVKKEQLSSGQYKVSRHEHILINRRKALDESLISKSERLKRNIEQKQLKLTKKIHKTRERQNQRIDRMESSKIYQFSPIVYKILTPFFAIGRLFKSIWRRLVRKAKDYQSRRPHRTFYLTNKGQSSRNIKMRGYFSFIGEVYSFLRDNAWLFTKFMLVYAGLSILIVGLMNQEAFNEFRNSLDKSGVEAWIKWPSLFSQAITNGDRALDPGQTILSAALLIYGWLTVVWLTRQRINGKKVNLRDGIYNSGGSIMSMVVIFSIIALQVVPAGLAFAAYNSMTAVGIINSGIQIENMAAWCAMFLIIILTLYWMVTSFIALIISSLPGMYPLTAMRAAGDLVVGRRAKILLRLVVMMIPIAVIWLAILTPAILLDSALKLTWQPLVPIVVLILSTITLLWCSSYIYILYRKLVDDPTPLPNKLAKRKRVYIWEKIYKAWKKRHDEATEKISRSRAINAEKNLDQTKK